MNLYRKFLVTVLLLGVLADCGSGASGEKTGDGFAQSTSPYTGKSVSFERQSVSDYVSGNKNVDDGYLSYHPSVSSRSSSASSKSSGRWKEKGMDLYRIFVETLSLYGLNTGYGGKASGEETGDDFAESTSHHAGGSVSSGGHSSSGYVSGDKNADDGYMSYHPPVSSTSSSAASQSSASSSLDDGGEEGEGTVSANPPHPEAKPAGWYMRTVLTASLDDGTVVMQQRGGVFGELRDSIDEEDRHDIASFGSAVLQMLFVNDNSDKTYFSDYRAYNPDAKKVWTFRVVNQESIDLSDASIAFTVEGPYDAYENTEQKSPQYIEKPSADRRLKSSLTLVDLDHQKTYEYEELKNTALSMDGKHTRTFRWVLGAVYASDMQMPSGAPVLRAAPLQRRKAGEGKFGLPPSF
jgi:hypothetical protein